MVDYTEGTGIQYHLKTKKGDVGRYVLLPGDPKRCQKIAAYFDDPVLIADSREFVTYTGKLDGVSVSVTSTGIGGPSAAIAVEELYACGADTFIRVGGSGGWNENVHPGDVVISSGAVRDEGMTASYVVRQYPAFANYEVLLSLIEAATENGHKFHVGITRSGDSEYCGWGKPSYGGYIQKEQLEIIDYYHRAGVLNTDRETSAIFTLTTLFGLRGGSICSIGDNVVNKEGFKAGGGHESAIAIALEGIRKLNSKDKEKEERGLKYWVPNAR